jgi:hypothetical protein
MQSTDQASGKPKNLNGKVARRVAMLEREAEDALYAYLECRDRHQRDRLYLVFQEIDREYQQAIDDLDILDRYAEEED